MGLIPGADGDKTVFPSGMQVDHISENTVGHGARPQAITNPATYPIAAGEIGEMLYAHTNNSSVATNTSTTTQIISLTLTAGVWLVSATAQHQNVASCTGATYRLLAKGTTPYGGKYGADTLILVNAPATMTCPFTFPTQVVVINPADANKTVSVTGISYGANGAADAGIFATRIA